MKINVIKVNNVEIASIKSNELLIKDIESALDLMATVRYETNCDCLIINKSSISKNIFNLK